VGYDALEAAGRAEAARGQLRYSIVQDHARLQQAGGLPLPLPRLPSGELLLLLRRPAQSLSVFRRAVP